MKHNFVDLRYNCRFEIVLQIWKIKVHWNYNFEGLEKNFDFKNKFVDLKYSYRFEIVF